MRALMAMLVLLAAPCATAQELAAARPLAVVEDATLRLGDVFAGAGPNAGLAIGASPLAGAHGLVWRPLSPRERVVVERPGRAVPREEIEAALQADLVRLGMEPTA